MDEKTCSACGGSGWVADGNEAKLCDCYQNRVYAVNREYKVCAIRKKQ